MPSQMTGWGSVEYTLTEETQSPGEELEGASVCPRNLHWVLRNKEIILGLHSSTNQTNIFSKECGYCSRHYKPCMFSKRERRDEYSMCRWCALEYDNTPKGQFQIHWHIHCNRLGPKICGKFRTLEPPPKPGQSSPKEAGIEDIAAPEVQFTVKEKMSQKERKAAQRAVAEDGFNGW